MSGGPSTASRVDVIDALRGFALAGVLLVNLGYLTLHAHLTEARKGALPTAAFDIVALDAMAVLVDVKAVTLFALLFGVGFALQLDRAGDQAVGRVPRYLRRMAILLAIGLAHRYLLWWGDILAMYAVVGALLVLFRRASDDALLVWALLLAIVLPPILIPHVRPLLPGPTQREVFEATLPSFLAGDSREVLRANADVVAWSHRANWPLVGVVGGRFLLGYWAGRRGLLQDPVAHAPLLRRLFQVGLVVGSAGSVLQVTQGALRATVPWLAQGAGSTVLGMVLRLAPLALGIAYGAGFVLLFERPAWRRRLALLAPVGRMALTNYLTQSLLAITLFYGLGLGIGPRFGVAGSLTAFVAINALQAWWSHAWLARFRLGPAEWLWRSLTLGKVQALRRAPADRVAQAA
jgi:uncharacterized protein